METRLIQRMKGRGISGCFLKVVAIITMLIDHTGATIVERYLCEPDLSERTYQILYYLDMLMRGIGRLAFPIFCFLIVEGFVHTHNLKKYISRMVLFAILSEVPFDLAFGKSFFDYHHNSVFLTLLLGLLTMVGMHFLQELSQKMVLIWQKILCDLGMTGIMILGMFAAEWMHTDYGAAGVLAIGMIYIFRSRPILGMALAVFSLGITCGMSEWFAFADVILLYFYNGTRGHQMKYFFYFFYPAHLLILSTICYLLGLGI